MLLAKISLGMARISTGNCILRRLLRKSWQLGAFSQLFVEGNILGEILKVCLSHRFLMTAMLAHYQVFLSQEELTQA